MFGNHSGNSLGPKNNYAYNASVPAAYVFSVLFGLCMLVHTGQIIRYRTIFMIVLLIAVVVEFVGYFTRIISIQHPDPQWPIIVSTVGLIVAPAFMAAQTYMIVGRMMAFIGGEYAIIKHTRITKIFVGADVFAILTQALGGAIISDASINISRLRTAKDILLVGLALQVITFVIFLFVATSFDVKSSRAPALKAYRDEMAKMRRLWLAFYIAGALITVRSIYRLIEFASVSFSTNITPGQSHNRGYLITHEWPFYVFDAVPIFVSTVLLSIFHPGRFLPRVKGRTIDQESSVTEMATMHTV